MGGNAFTLDVGKAVDYASSYYSDASIHPDKHADVLTWQWQMFIANGSIWPVATTEVIRRKQNPLLHIRDLYDTALCLRVLWILHHSHIQFLLAFAECDVCCAITSRNLKYV